jgi:16S rRNA (cytosine1402-N4)-methyltransferase
MSALSVREGGVYADCTSGGGGHSSEIARRMGKTGRLICLDRDDEAIAACSRRLSEVTENFTMVKSNFEYLGGVLDDLGIEAVDGVLWDLGVSSRQLDAPERGFSYMADAPLDMRMDTKSPVTAADVVNGYDAARLAKVIREYGEEKFANIIAQKIAERRASHPIETTGELVEVIREAIPKKAQKSEAQHPAKRTFQAIRIEVNGELDAIEPSIRAAVDRLRPGGRAAVISFHSLEDRIVKRLFRELENPCTCPPDFPVCVCGKKPLVKVLKDVTASEAELEANPRARSARLRVAEKL